MAMSRVERKADQDSRSMKGTLPATGGTLALAVAVTLLVGIVGGTTAGYYLGLSLNPPGGPGGTPGEDVTFRLLARYPNFYGMGGAIEGVENPDLVVNRGDRVTIILENGETNMHDVYVDGFNVGTDYVMTQGQTASVTFVADEEGTFPYYCTVQGHRAAGMEGRVVVGSGTGGGGTLPPPGPAKATTVDYIAKNPTDLPGPLNRGVSATVHLFLGAEEVTAEIEPGTTLDYWTYNGTVPGPFFRVRVNDTVVVHFRNDEGNLMEHSVDFHAVTGPGGGAASAKARPGLWGNFTFRPLNPGLFVYHCATPHIPTHISLGMYGLILVEPEAGLPTLDAAGRPIKELYVMQGDVYTKWPAGTDGHQLFDDAALLREDPAYVVFNGRYQALTGNHAMQAVVNDTVRIFFGVGGPNLISSFHVIGEIFDRVYAAGDVLSPPQQSVQTVLVAPGGATIVEFTLQVAADYILVDHSLTRAINKGALGILSVSGTSVPGVYEGSGGTGH